MKEDIILNLDKVCVSYTSDKMAVRNVTAAIERNKITAIMGPSGCGKSTLLRAVNRMHELYRNIRVSGQIMIDGVQLLQMDPMQVRRQVGMVFQRPNPFPTMSIFENVLAGYSLTGIRLTKKEKEEIVETQLRNVGLWDEVKDSLQARGTFLSGGQQQRLCIARAMALKPNILLLDEPTSALDPIATERIEDLLLEMKKEVTLLMVTHNMGQASRISDNAMVMYLGELVAYDKTSTVLGGNTEGFRFPVENKKRTDSAQLLQAEGVSGLCMQYC